jgi:hypothetical protein
MYGGAEYSSTNFDLDVRWSWVVSFTPHWMTIVFINFIYRSQYQHGGHAKIWSGSKAVNNMLFTVICECVKCTKHNWVIAADKFSKFLQIPSCSKSCLAFATTDKIKLSLQQETDSVNACHHSVQNLLSFHLLSKNIKNRNIEIYNFVSVSVWVWNLVSDIKEGT